MTMDELYAEVSDTSKTVIIQDGVTSFDVIIEEDDDNIILLQGESL